MKKPLWLLSLTFLISSGTARADDVALQTVGPSYKKTKKHHLVQAQAGINSLSSNISSQVGLGYGVDYFYSFNNLWGSMLSVSQGVNTSLQVLSTDIAGSAVYAWKGKLINERIEIANEGQDVATIDPLPTSTWIITAGIKQTYFNGTETILPLTGPTFSLQRRFPSKGQESAVLGGAFDYTFNGQNNLITLKVFVGANFSIF